jgi:uncharacterized protein YjbJ (UPF0337 family)
LFAAIPRWLYLLPDFLRRFTDSPAIFPQVCVSSFPRESRYTVFVSRRFLWWYLPDLLRHGGQERRHVKEAFMNWDQIEGKWKQYSGKMKEKWGKLTNDDLTTIGGKRDQLSGMLQERYGMAKDQAERQIDEFTRSLSETDVAKHTARRAGH